MDLLGDLDQFRLGPPDEGDSRALRGDGQGDATADPLPGAGDQGLAADERPRHRRSPFCVESVLLDLTYLPA